MSAFTPKPKIIILSLASAFSTLTVADTIEASARPEQYQELDTVVVSGKRTNDQKGADDVYYKNVSNAYVGKEYLERYRVQSAGDVLKGLNGVYNMNTRTAGGAITPNIRGITGKGRIPVTLDGTEQTVDVWLNNYGVGDRNYLDPALFRSIAVEKSPALTRGVKSGVGGAVTIRTIEAADIVPEGKKFGFQLKTEFSNNSNKQANNLNQWLGWEDYRTLPFGATADGAGGGFDPLTGQQSPQALVADGLTPPAHKSGRDNWRFGGDRSYMAAAAFKTELSDGLAAYSYRNKGNYFAGRKGAEGYLHNPVYDLQKCYDQGGSDFNCKNSATFVPNMAKVYHPGVEVLNSNTETKTLLLKNNWRLPGSHRLGWQYMRTDVRFGEINPFHTTYVMNMEEHNPSSRPKALSPQMQNIDSTIRTDTYKLGWDWKPEGSRWLDLQTNLWRIKTDSTRHQSGGMELSVAGRDLYYDAWHWCNRRGQLPPEQADSYADCNELLDDFGISGMSKEEVMRLLPNNNGQYRVLSGAEQKTRVSRTGFDISNRFRLSDRLSMTLAADYQKEKLAEEVEIVNSQDLFNLAGMATGMTKLAGPRGGERREWGTNLVFDWQATDRLKISAGIRYHNFRGFDTALAEGRARRDPRYKAEGGGSMGSIGPGLTCRISSWWAIRSSAIGTRWPNNTGRLSNRAMPPPLPPPSKPYRCTANATTCRNMTTARIIVPTAIGESIMPDMWITTIIHLRLLRAMMPPYTGYIRFLSLMSMANWTAAYGSSTTISACSKKKWIIRKGCTAATTVIGWRATGGPGMKITAVTEEFRVVRCYGTK